MKRNLFICAISIVMAFTSISCNNNDQTEVEKRTEYLTTRRGWKLTAATSSPPYEKRNGDMITNLFDGYFRDFETDDIVYYNQTGSVDVDPGRLTPPSGEPGFSTRTTMGTWSFLNDAGTRLRTHIPFMISYGNTAADVNVTALDERNLRFNFTFTEEDNDPAKAARVYTFSLTYERN